MSRLHKRVCLTAGILLLIILLLAVVLPVVARNQLTSLLEKTTGRKSEVSSVSFNPFTLTATITGLTVHEPHGAPLLRIESIRSSLGLASLYRRGLILSEVSLNSPAITFTRNAPNRYSFSDILERVQSTKPDEKKKSVLFSLNNIKISNGSLDFSDQAVAGGRKHTIRSLNLAVPFISNMPYLADKYIDPRLSGTINGAPFSFAGKLKPLSSSLETDISLELNRLDLPKLAAYLPQAPPVELAKGTLTLATTVSYRISAKKIPELVIKGRFRTDNLAVNQRDGQPLLRLPALELRASRMEIFRRFFEVESFDLSGVELFASRNGKGQWMYQQLMPAVPRTTREQGGAKGSESTSPPVVSLGRLGIKDGVVHFRDDVPSGGFKTDLSEIDLDVSHLSTAAAAPPATYQVSLLMDNLATLECTGSLSPTTRAATASIELSDLQLQRGWPYLSAFLTAPVKGALDLSGQVSFEKDKGLRASDVAVELRNLATRYSNQDGVDLALLKVSGASFDLKKNSLEAEEIALSKGSISLSRETDGSLSPLALLKQSKPSAAARHTPPGSGKPGKAGGATAARPGAAPLSYRLKRLQVDQLNLAFSDKTRPAKPRFTLRNTQLSLSNLNGPRFTPARLRFSSTFGARSPLKASGDITPLPFRYKGDLSVGQLPLRAFEDYFPDNLNVFIIGGNLDSTMKIDLALVNGAPTGWFKGSSGIRGFHAIDTVAEEDLLRWESLQLDDMQGNLAPFNLALREIALTGVYSRIIIRKDGTLNLQNLVKKAGNGDQGQEKADKGERQPVAGKQVKGAGDEEPGQPGQPANAVSPAGRAAVPTKGKVTIDAITIQGGTLAFNDHHLPQEFATTFYNLGGRVSGLSSEDASFAEVDLRGNLENHSPLQITGQINPLRDDLFVDLKVAFRDIELSPVTPYSGTYLGYSVEKGKLYLDLKYHIEKKLLNSENRIFIDQFTFGERVDSPKATRLPVKLGLALLKDRKGEIHLDVPVTGRTDDPQFSMWRLVFQALKNLMVKAVTSPFSLLSSMFGQGQDFSAVLFANGQSSLSDREEQKLQALAKALNERPALKMELKGYVDRERDREGYRRELLERKLRNEKLLALTREGLRKEGEQADTVQVLPDERDRYLAAVYKKEKFPKPRNVLGFVKDLPPDEMQKLIIANTVISDSDLQTLARERVVAVMNYLVSRGKVPAERIFQKKDDVFKAPTGEGVPHGRVELNAMAQ